MRFLGLSIAEVVALISLISILMAGANRFYHLFRTTISAPLIESMDKLRLEISQLENYVVKEYGVLKSKTEKLEERLRLQEQRRKKEAK